MEYHIIVCFRVASELSYICREQLVFKSFEKCQRRKYRNSPDCFCYICGHFIIKKQMIQVNGFVRKVYYAYFHVKLGDQDKCWAPHIVFKNYAKTLRQWTHGKKQ